MFVFFGSNIVHVGFYLGISTFKGNVFYAVKHPKCLYNHYRKEFIEWNRKLKEKQS